MPRSFLIDLYGTLVDGDWDSLRDVLASRLGMEPRVLSDAFATTRVARNIGTFGDVEGDTRAVIQATGIDPPDDVVHDLATLTHEFLERRVHPFPDALPAVAALRERGHPTVLVSNCSHDTRSLVDRLGLPDLFDEIVLSFEVGSLKPQPGIYRTALEALGDVAPEDAVFVDDQAAFCDGAGALGIDTRLIQRDLAGPDDPATPAMDGHRVITDLSQLLDR